MSKYERLLYNDQVAAVSLFADDPFSECDEAPQRMNPKKIVDRIVKSDLTPRQKDVIMLYYYEKRSQREIAALWNVSESTVSRTKKRACENVKKRLQYYF